MATHSLLLLPMLNFLLFKPIILAFKAHVRSVGTLSPEVKKALKKPSCHRTPKDLALIQNVIMKIKTFETYSTALKAELSRVLSYEKFGKGRVVVQQGIYNEHAPGPPQMSSQVGQIHTSPPKKPICKPVRLWALEFLLLTLLVIYCLK